MTLFSSIVAFFLRHVLRRTKEEVGRVVTTVGIGVAYAKHTAKAKICRRSKL
jgi:hypothetical protein